MCHSDALQKEEVNTEKLLLELDEELYESLPDEQKECITQRQIIKMQHQKLRYCISHAQRVNVFDLIVLLLSSHNCTSLM